MSFIIIWKGCDFIVIYADILFAINFSMDFLSLFITSMIVKRKTSRTRIIIASLVGALYGVLDVTLGLNRIWGALICIIFTVLMCVIAFFGTGVKGILVSSALLLGVGATLGGTMSIVYSFLNKIFAEIIKSVRPSDAYNSARFFLIASVSAIISIIFARIFLREKNNKTATLKIDYDGAEYTFYALVDSGNKLCDPLSQKPVILVSNSSKIARNINNKDDKYKRFIPYKDVGGEGILKGVIPKKIYVNDNLVDGVVCVTENGEFSSFDALIPSSLV